MAAIKITPAKIKMNEFNDLPATTAIDAADGGLVRWNGADERMLLFVENSATSAATITIKGGDGIQSANDLALSVPASTTKLVTLESGGYLMTTGADKGYIKITGAATAKIAAVIL